jgi:hypothetical protein
MVGKVALIFIRRYPVSFNGLESSDQLRSLVCGLMDKEATRRIGAQGFEKEILEHAYFQ